MSISKPEVTHNAGTFLFSWEQEGIKARLDRIHEDSRHDVKGELLVKYASTWDIPGAGHLYLNRISLLSATSKRTTVKALEEQHDLDWVMVLEAISHHVLRILREGEPAVALGDVAIPERIKYRIEPLLTDGEPNLLFGEGGIGKSYLADYLSMIVSEGILENGLIPEPGPVLYLDYETSAVATARRFKALHAGWGIESPPTVMYRYCYQSLATEVQELQRIVVNNGIQMVIVDSAGPACGGEPESAQAAIQFFAALRSLRVTTLTIAHKAKHSAVGPFGSVYWVNHPRNIYEIRKSQEQDNDTINLGLFHRKVNDGRLLKPMGFKFTFADSTVTVSTQRVEDVPDLVGELSISDQIAHAIAGGAMSVQDIAETLDQRANTISVAFSRNTGSRFTKLPDGRWGLSV